MKVLLLAPLPPPSGGIASWTIRYKAYCDEKGIPYSIINTAMLGERASSETMKRSIKVECKRSYKIIRELKKQVKDSTNEVVHINTSCSPYGVMRDALCINAIRKKMPIIVHCRCNIADQLGQRYIALHVFKYIIKRASAVIVLNKQSKEYVDRIEKNKAIYIPNFISEKAITNDHYIKNAIENVIYVGHIEKAKGFLQIVEAAKSLPNINFSLLGAIREDLSGVNIPPNIHFLGRVQYDEVEKYLIKSDAFILPSLSEGFSNALLEAMAKGLPIIASDVGANSVMIEDEGGILLKRNTGVELCQAIQDLNTKDRKGMSEWNIDKVRKAYTVDKVMGQYFELYARVTKK